MTKIFYREYYDRYLLIVEGHSGFGEKGKDIVCSAVSILVYTLLNMLKDEESDKHLILRREVINDGYFCVEVEPFDFSGNFVQLTTVIITAKKTHSDYYI